MTRAILHSDLNAFYASAEVVMRPELAGLPVAVCGSPEDRHGIVLAKSEQAKKAGVKTGMAIWQAKQCCPQLKVVMPHYDLYLTFSQLVRNIYADYTDLIEPFGLDENWLDVTASTKRFGTPLEIAEDIRRRVREEIGLTVSIGVSFNKAFAKLGSDMKKPDAITLIDENNFKEKVWRLPVENLLYVGPSSAKKLHQLHILTIGDLAQMEEGVLRRIFGVNGTMLWMYANGQDHSRVMQNGETLPIKSVGHGITCNADLTSDEEVRRVILELCQNIGLRLCQAGMVAKGIQVDIKDHELCVFSWMDGMPTATRSRRVLAQQAFLLYRKRYQGQRRIRAVTVRAIRLEKAGESTQLDYFCDYVKTDKLERIEQVTDELTTRFGHTALCPADVLINDKTKTKEHYQATMPHGMRKL